MSNLKALGANNEYVQHVKDYGKTDALLSVILYCILLLMSVVMGKIFIHKQSELTDIYIFCATGIFSIICTGLVISFCLIRKQRLNTVGFSKKNAGKSFIIGLILIFIVFLLWGIRPIISGISIKADITFIAMKVIHYLIFIAFTEELIFRGYIGTRIYGYFRNKYLAIIVVGIMFTLSHVPLQMIVSRTSLPEFISANISNLINIFIHHLLSQWLFSKYNSIIAPTLLHFIEDFISGFLLNGTV